MIKVDIGIACGRNQSQAWWQPVMTELLRSQQYGIEVQRIHSVVSAMPDHNKNHVLDDRRMRRTDVNRNKAVHSFMADGAEWMFWIDDDTVPPMGALPRLVELAKAQNFPAVAGIYFLAKPPHNPIAYMRRPDGLYGALWEYPHGAILPVDSVGMGCTLTHRSIFEKIQAEFLVFQRPNGSIYPVHKNRVDEDSQPGSPDTFVSGREYVKGMQLITPLKRVEDDDPRPFPFFAMEYCRTEDHHFWELCGEIGIRPVVDTSLACRHWREADYGLEHYAAAREVEREGN